jgi:hypothetical protein
VFGTRYRGRLGARSLNLELQRALNRPGEAHFRLGFGPGDKVMQVENNYEREVFNGDLGVVSRGLGGGHALVARWYSETFRLVWAVRNGETRGQRNAPERETGTPTLLGARFPCWSRPSRALLEVKTANAFEIVDESGRPVTWRPFRSEGGHAAWS